MSVGSDKFRTKKRDQSPYLFHFTSGTEYEATETLKTILKEKRLRSKRDEYICFTASPITQIGEFFETLVYRTGQPMYQPYGIGFSRDILISKYGAKNVIYGDEADEKTMTACGMGWRFLKLDVESCDFEWMREWRVSGKEFDFSGFPMEHIIVIAPTDDKLLDFVTKDYCVRSWDYDENIGEKFDGCLEMYSRSWKGISIDYIRNKSLIDDYRVSGSTVSQIIGENMFDEVTKQMSRRTKELNEAIAKSWEETFGATLSNE